MRFSRLFAKTLKLAPSEAETISHKLLIRGGFIDRQLTSGIYSFLPLGWRVHEKICKIIREEMKDIGGQEVFLPSLQPKELWMRSDRWDNMDPPLFKLKDRHDKDLALGSTHEEVMTDLVARFINSYKDLPLALFQIQEKFRNEMRPSGGLFRVREFIMKDLYSFHANKEDLDEFYLKVIEAYKRIFYRCGFHAKIVEAVSGTIGGSESHEFMMICATGEDKILCCVNCDWAANIQKSNLEKCPKCGQETKLANSVENGHIFKLGTKYALALGAYFIDRDGQKKLMEMGCYGIGIGRLMATVVEAHNDDNGIIWPEKISPYDIYLIDLNSGMDMEELYGRLSSHGLEVLWDDREEVMAGEKFADADLIGIPIRLVVSERTDEQRRIELKKRAEEKVELFTLEEILSRLRSI